MSRKVTSKRPNAAKNVSHAKNRTNKKQNLNFQYVTINGIKFKTTAREARTLRKLTNK
ncbi:MAG: 50S ribosomal protein L28 [Bacilli bacterium]|nr:50S ribosomal protein L28 [Bacilli bacterium]